MTDFDKTMPNNGVEAILEDARILIAGESGIDPEIGLRVGEYALWAAKKIHKQEDEYLNLLTAFEELEQKAKTDELTGCGNRNSLEDVFAIHGLRAIEENRPFVLFFVDVDKLKVVNDGISHKEGDKYLVAVAELLKNWAGEGYSVVRWGGDEFSVVGTLPEVVDPEERATMVEKSLRTHVNRGLGQNYIPTIDEEISKQLGISVGFEVIPVHKVQQIIDQISRGEVELADVIRDIHDVADARMYRDKDV